MIDSEKIAFIKETLGKENIKIYDVCEKPFSVHGLMLPDSEENYFRRIPSSVARETSKNVEFLGTNTAGGRVCFATDSDFIGIFAELQNISEGSNMSLIGKAGCDMYCKENGVWRYTNTFVPPADTVNEYTNGIDFKKSKMREHLTSSKMRDFIINFPSYAGVIKFYVILSDSAVVSSGKEYKHQKPVLYYGSSITQGACASRPGNSYQNIISRELDCDYINLGFSGSALAEDALAEYISRQNMSIFVYDYDHNAPNPEHLEKTHAKMYNTIRRANPDLPIVCISKPDWFSGEEDNEKRCSIIKATVENAKNEGDNNIYFVDIKEMQTNLCEYDSMFVDGCHPNDFGLSYMANVISKVLKKLL